MRLHAAEPANVVLAPDEPLLGPQLPGPDGCGPSSGSPGHGVGAMLAALPPTEYPLTVEVAGDMGAYGSAHHYEFVLDQLLTGLRTRPG